MQSSRGVGNREADDGWNVEPKGTPRFLLPVGIRTLRIAPSIDWMGAHWRTFSATVRNQGATSRCSQLRPATGNYLGPDDSAPSILRPAGTP